MPGRRPIPNSFLSPSYETNFRKYEVWLGEILTHFPNPVTFPVTPLSPRTVASQLRLAGNAFVARGYQSTLSHETFSKIWRDVELGPTQDDLFVRAFCRNAAAAPVVLKAPSTSTYFLDVPADLVNQTVVASCAWLHYHSLNSGRPSRFHSDPNIVALPEGIEVIEQEDGTYLLL